MRQYREAKQQHPDGILLFRLGDFYEIFFEDAIEAAPIMGVTLTSRPLGKSGRAPMCGVPHHAWQGYVGKLLRAGRKVVICDQVEAASGKGVVKRDVTRVLTPASGQVLSLNVKVGDPVKKGETLFYINSREAAAAITEHLESHKDLQLAEKTHAMTLDLFQHQAASVMALRQAESDLAKARAHVARTEESLRVLGLDVDRSERSERLDSRIPVRSPLGGTVIERRVTEGQFVQPDSNPLLVVADLSTVWVLADIFEHDLHLVSLGQKAEVSTVAYPDRRFMARVSRISDSLDPTTHTVKVRFLADNSTGQLKPEMFATVTLILSQATQVLTVPAMTVFVEGERNYVFVLQSDHHLTRQQVNVVPDPSGRARVVGGLQAGDRVVSDGALLLQLEESKKESS